MACSYKTPYWRLAQTDGEGFSGALTNTHDDPPTNEALPKVSDFGERFRT